MKIDYEEFFKVLEEHFCKKCEYYDPSKGHLWEDASCCKLKEFDKCIILYLTGEDCFDEEF